MMNSSRASPTPSFGKRRNSNASSGLPTFIMSLAGTGGILSSATSTTSTSSLPSYTWPVSPSVHDTVTSAPSGRVRVASPHPTTAGMPSSRAMIAAWHVRPPRLVTIAAARFITGSQSGSVMSATSTSPDSTFSISEADLTRRTAPWPTFCPIARPEARIFDVDFKRKRRSVLPFSRDFTVSGRACRM